MPWNSLKINGGDPVEEAELRCVPDAKMMFACVALPLLLSKDSVLPNTSHLARNAVHLDRLAHAVSHKKSLLGSRLIAFMYFLSYEVAEQRYLYLYLL